MQEAVFAIISNGKVKNLSVGTQPDCYRVGLDMYGPNTITVEVWSMYYPAGIQIPVMEGDDYINGKFYRNGEEIIHLGTVDQITYQNTQMIESNGNNIRIQGENAEDTDQLILDHEERIILLEVGE